MHIAWLDTVVWPDTVGGVTARVEALSRYMARLGHHVELWISSLPAGTMRELSERRTVIGVGGKPVPGAMWRLGPAWNIWQAVRHLPLEKQVDVIFSPSPLLVTACIIRRCKVPTLYTPGGTMTGSLRGDFAHKSGWLLPRLGLVPSRQFLMAEKFCLRHANGIIAVSEVLKQQVLRTLDGINNRVRVIHNGYDPERFAVCEGAETEDSEPAGRPFTAIFVGRLHRIKNIGHLLKAWACVRHPHKRLLIVGDGTERAALEAMANELDLGDTVMLLGQRLDVPDLLRVCDVFVLPSLFDSCPAVVIQAMGASLPCITLKNVAGVSEVGASGEINLDGITGFCVDPLDPADMANRLGYLAADPAKRREMGEAARKRVLERFTWERAAVEYLKFAEELLAANPLTSTR